MRLEGLEGCIIEHGNATSDHRNPTPVGGLVSERGVGEGGERSRPSMPPIVDSNPAPYSGTPYTLTSGRETGHVIDSGMARGIIGSSVDPSNLKQ